ncbi:MAG: NAD(P)-binding domain-containing protein [bacterium]|nr:NAD(P)-binding domain-containing protein [bacterium]
MPDTAGATSKRRKIVATVPPQEILPIVNGNYESNIRGIYVIGDVTGLPLVKVAANHGVDMIERMDRRGLFPREGGEDDLLDLVIVGGGPAGLSAALEAHKRGLRYVVIERTRIASTVHGFPPGKKVYSEPRFLKNRSELPVEGDRVKDDFLAAVAQTVSDRGLHVKEGDEVKRVIKKGERRFEVATESGKVFAGRQVIVAVGRQGQARTLEVSGEDLPGKVMYRLHTADDYRDKDVLVVGGGNSAVEAALMLCDHNRVTLSYRKAEFFRLKAENQRRLDEALAAGRLDVVYESNVREIRENEVELDVGGESRIVANDHVLILIGTLPPVEFLLDMGLELDGVWTRKRVAWSVVGVTLGVFVYFFAKKFELLPGGDRIHIPGFAWLYRVVPEYFSNLYGMYYLLYFLAIAGFGVYWALRYKNRIVWRRNLSNIVFNWTLWWGIPTFLVALYGRNVWTGVLPKTVNAWPLNMLAFNVSPVVGPGDPVWWHTAAVVGVVWAAMLTFIVFPLFTVLVGKHYCSHLCSCGALAETVGNAFRHRGPKGDLPRWLERFGYVFILFATVATVADLLGYQWPLGFYNRWVGTLLAGALAIGLYPFLGQRIWCRYWCPLAFWMNFWGRWSRFKISPEPGKCIDCNVCNQYCQMGIDIKTRALQGRPVTLKDTPCVACGECVVRCPMEILHLGMLPPSKPYTDGTDAGEARTLLEEVRDVADIPKMNERCADERRRGGKD